MKKNPQEKEVIRDMQAGRLILDGFLGDDDRKLEEIVDEDRQVLERLGSSAEEVAKAMRNLSREGMRALGSSVDVDGYRVESDEWMGWHGCPFKDGSRAAKRISAVTRLSDGAKMNWSDLHIHLIEAHGFFQGKGSAHRLEPEELVRFLGLGAEEE